MGLAGCGIKVTMLAGFGMTAILWQDAGITITSGSGISCFYRVGMRDSQGE